MTERTEWVENLQRRVYEFWADSSYELGVKIFYGPIPSDPEILILGFQPGGEGNVSKAEDIVQNDNYPIKKHHHEYVNKDYPIAREMRNLFGECNDILSETVKTNLFFFHAPDQDSWNDTENREELEDFCIERHHEIMDEINPNLVIVEGISTWDRFTEEFGFESDVVEKRGNERLVCESSTDNPKAMGFMHPSGARLSREDKDIVREKILQNIASNTSYLSKQNL